MELLRRDIQNLQILISFNTGRCVCSCQHLEPNQSKQGHYLILWKITLDVLPVQASSVACKQFFSSSEETDSDCYLNLSPVILWLLKCTFQQDCLLFIEDLVCSKKEPSVIDVPKSIHPHIQKIDQWELELRLEMLWRRMGLR